MAEIALQHCPLLKTLRVSNLQRSLKERSALDAILTLTKIRGESLRRASEPLLKFTFYKTYEIQF